VTIRVNAVSLGVIKTPMHPVETHAQLGALHPVDNWRFHMYHTVKGSDWLGDQDAIEYVCRKPVPAVLQLKHCGVPFSRMEDGRIYQRPVRRSDPRIWEGDAKRTCAAADRTGHAILHTLHHSA